MIERLSANYPFIIGAFVFAAFVALIVWLSLRSQMKLAKVSKINMSYIDNSKVKIRKSKDVFLYEETKDSRNG